MKNFSYDQYHTDNWEALGSDFDDFILDKNLPDRPEDQPDHEWAACLYHWHYCLCEGGGEEMSIQGWKFTANMIDQALETIQYPIATPLIYDNDGCPLIDWNYLINRPLKTYSLQFFNQGEIIFMDALNKTHIKMLITRGEEYEWNQVAYIWEFDNRVTHPTKIYEHDKA